MMEIEDARIRPLKGATVRFTYRKPGEDEEVERTVENVTVKVAGTDIVVVGFCPIAQAVRSFRIDRMTSFEVVRLAVRAA